MNQSRSPGRKYVGVLLGAALAVATLGCGQAEPTSREPVGTASLALGTLPGGWSFTDIGVPSPNPNDPNPPPAPNDPVHDPLTGAFTVQAAKASGPSHGNPEDSDHYRFFYRHVEGDAEVVVRLSRITAITGSIQNATLGVAIRADKSVSGGQLPPSDRQARAGAGVFQVRLPPAIADDTCLFKGNGVCESRCPNDPEPGDPPCCGGTSGGTDRHDCFDGNEISTYVRSALPTPLGATGVYDGRNVQTPVWLRLRRVGKDFAVSWRPSDDGPWEQASAFGGDFSSSGAYIGFFAAGNSGPVEAVFDNVYVGPPRSDNRSTWIGSSSSQLSTGLISRGMHSLYVGNDAAGVTRVFKQVSNSEGPPGTNLFDQDGKQLRLPGADPAWFGAFVNQGAITGEGGTIYAAGSRASNWNGPFCVNRYSFDLELEQACAAGVNLDRIGGMAAHAGKVYVSQPDVDGDTVPNEDRIVVLDGTTLNVLYDFAVESTQPRPLRPSALAFDTSPGNHGKLWVLQGNTDYPNPGNYATDPQKYAEVRCYQTASNPPTPCGAIVATNYAENFSALTYHPSENRLVIADNGPAQNVFLVGSIYGSAPTWTPIGPTGGIFSGTSPGLNYDPASGGQARFYNPSGVGVDAAGAIYVASGTGTFDLRKFTRAGAGFSAAWTKPVHGIGSAVLDFDPSTDGQDAYSPGFRFKLDLAQTAPGAEWRLHSLTQHPFRYDERSAQGEIGRRGYAPIIRYHLLPNGVQQRYLYLWGQNLDSTSKLGYRSSLDIFWFDGEIAVPAGSIDYVCNTASSLGNLTLWRDTNRDGKRGSNDLVVTNFGNGPKKLPCVQQVIVDVDEKGDIWLNFGNDTNNGGTSYPLWQVPYQGLLHVGTAFVPMYDIADAAMIAHPMTDGLAATSYDSRTDTLYAWGGSPLVPNSAAIFAYGNFTTTGRYTRFAKPLVMRSTLPGSNNGPQRGLARAGDKLFVSDRFGAVYVFEASDGTPVTALTAGPEGSGIQAWQDVHMGVRAFRRQSGEYLVNVYDTFTLGRHLLHRWTPRACEASVRCTASDACAGWWRGDITADPTYRFADSSGLANHADRMGAMRAASFEGPGASLSANSYLSAAGATSLDIRDAATLAAWIQPTSNTRLQYVIAKGAAYELGIDANGRPFVQLNGTSSGRVTAASSVPANNWTHVAATYDRASVRLYVNGAKVAEAQFQAQILVNDVRLGIGAQCTGGSTCSPDLAKVFQGLLDDVRLFARSLPPEQIAILARRGPVVSFAFEESGTEMIKDSSGACNGAVSFQTSSNPVGKTGRGLNFNGTSSYVELSHGSELDARYSFTLAAWVAPAQKATKALIRKGLTTGDAYELGLSASGFPFAQLKIGGSNLVAQSKTASSAYPVTPSATAWMHLAATYDGGVLRLYINKALRAQVNVPNSPAFSNALPVILGAANGPTEHFNGQLDDVKIYRRALSAAEISALP